MDDKISKLVRQETTGKISMAISVLMFVGCIIYILIT